MTSAVDVTPKSPDSRPSLWDAFKVFSKLYNAVYCSRESPPSEAESGAGIEEAPEVHPEHELTERHHHHHHQQSQQGDGCSCEEQWFQAVNEQDTTTVQQLLHQQTVDVNITDENDWAALHLAAWNGYSELCDVLLTVPSLDVDLPGPGGSTALSLACQRAHLPIIHRLLDAKCDVNRTATLDDSHGVTALHLAAQNGHAEVVKLLVCAGAVINACMTVKGVQGVTPLHLAVESDKLEVMDLLIEAGCNIHSSTQPCTDTLC